MAKAIIAKENLDCHNVVYLIDRNYANKYHNNIDIEIGRGQHRKPRHGLQTRPMPRQPTRMAEGFHRPYRTYV